MQARVQKWGNSLAVRLPKALADEVQVTVDSPVEVLVRDHEIVLRPKKGYRLDDLLAGITAENLHAEENFGAPGGRDRRKKADVLATGVVDQVLGKLGALLG